ncbi:conserved hypothetical protein [Histoplasma capsulatum var. duboisii H88]|uniref:Uncharacterized protein n=1 Tax=Ajellomyces capsulatus (strain H88) TaxID=544711 RepID=F0UIN6_AJEC8|nr:conserved hypothetical protein [Histoplasma capsulatum var. duboisii H88]QSS57062.1 hypothetical protein I7I53_05454 [Histoplasma capsulatum var. duboisii H88]
MKASMVLKLCAILSGLAQSSLATESDYSEIMRNLQVDPNGLIHVDEFGIMRSLDGDGKVIDFARLGPSHLNTLAQRRPEEDREELLAIWSGADHSMIDDEEIWNPSENIMASIRERAAVEGSSKVRT